MFTSAEQHYSTIVSENMGERQTDITVLPGDFVRIVGGGSIWAGVWLTGENGPAGWPAPFASSPPYPHATYRYSLLAYLDGRWAMPLPGFTEGHGWFWVGDVKYVTYLGPPTRLKIGINVDVPGNGSGHFTANVMVQRGK